MHTKIIFPDEHLKAGRDFETKISMAQARSDVAAAKTAALRLEFGRAMVAMKITDRSTVAAYRSQAGLTQSAAALWSYIEAALVLPDTEELIDVSFNARRQLVKHARVLGHSDVTVKSVRDDSVRLILSLPSGQRGGGPLQAVLAADKIKRQDEIRKNTNVRPYSIVADNAWKTGMREGHHTFSRTDNGRPAIFTFDTGEVVEVRVGSGFTVRI